MHFAFGLQVSFEISFEFSGNGLCASDGKTTLGHYDLNPFVLRIYRLLLLRYTGYVRTSDRHSYKLSDFSH